MPERLKIDEPLWDQSTFVGRFKHFLWVTDPRSCVVSEETLDNAKILVEQYRKGKEPPGTSVEQVIYAKKLYESAFHPDSGEKQNVFGRMSFQVPGGMAVTGAMLQWYRTAPAVVFWQWVNQSFNALVNYTNRNANSPTTTKQLVVAYVSATGSAMITALGCKSYWTKRASPFVQVRCTNRNEDILMKCFFPEVRTVRSSSGGEFCQHPSNETERIVARNRLFRCQREHRVSVETCCGQGNISSYHIEDRHVCPWDAHLARHNGKTGKVPLDAEDQGVARTYSSIGCGMLLVLHGTNCLWPVSAKMFNEILDNRMVGTGGI
jgi:hypothetical protein